jgi:dihydrofolate synthase/folylpolyglutamate synthase
MNYTQTLDYLYRKLPMFTRIGAAALKKDLHNTIALCEHLGNPQLEFKSIHVAGTNGKGSTSHMLAAVLQQAGYKTGLYTSPHLKDFRERIRINGKMISKSFVSTFVESEKHLIEEIDPSFFEVTVALAFSYFAREKVDIAIIEVGLGGRLDSTNIITPELSVITNISLDHMNILGDSLKQIAFEKAGIIKPGIPVVVGESQTDTNEVFIEKAINEESSLTFADENLHVKSHYKEGLNLHVTVANPEKILFQDIILDLTGSYQLKNLLTVLQAVNVLRTKGYEISEDDMRKGLEKVTKITGLQGRWQTISSNPTVICDTGHNIAGITEVLYNLKNTPYCRLHMVMGMVKDKDINTILSILPKDASYYWTQPDLERALPATELAAKGDLQGLKGQTFSSVTEALSFAKIEAQKDDLIFVGGSTFVVAEVL